MSHPLSKALREGVQNDGYDYEIEEANRLMAQSADALDARATTEADWQDISTAPKDGTVVLVYDPKWQPPLTACFYEFPPRSGARWHYTWDHSDSYGRLEPTHWMPLPRKPGEPK